MTSSLLMRDHMSRGYGAPSTFNKAFFCANQVVILVLVSWMLLYGGGATVWGWFGVDGVQLPQGRAIMVAIAADLYTVKVIRWIACVAHSDVARPGTAMFFFVYHLFAFGSLTLFAYEKEGAWWLSQVPYNSEWYPYLGIFGILLTWAALCGEALADQQLKDFKVHKDIGHEDHPGGDLHSHFVCNIGLWNRCRHPNLFFNLFPFAFVALTAGNFIIMFAWIFVQVFWAYTQAMPQHEAYMANKYGDEWEEYCEKIPQLFPRGYDATLDGPWDDSAADG